MIRIDTRKLTRILCAGVLCSLPAHSPAQETNAADTQLEFIDFSSGPAIDIPVETREVEGVERITIVLDDVSLEDTVRMFAQTTSANIIASVAQLRDKQVSVNLQDVEWKPALRSILDIHGFELAEKTPGSGIYAIQVKAPDAPEPTEVRTFFLNFTTTAEVETPIRSMLGSNSSLTLFPSRNAMVIRASAPKLAEVETLLIDLDRPGKQVLIEAKILELTDSAMKQLGIRWDSLEAFGVRAQAGPFTRSEQTERTSSYLDGVLNYDRTARLNTDGRSSDGTVSGYRLSPGLELPEVSEDDSRAGGISFPPPRELVSSGTTGWDLYSENLRGSARDSLTFDTFTRTISESSAAILQLDELRVILSALEKTDGVSIISNPKMIVTSGSTNATFSVGEREPIIATELQRGTAESPGDVITASLATDINTDFIKQGYLETGVDLKVVATVKTDDLIEAQIRPSLRRLLGNKEVGENSWPIISVKEISTGFTLRSGQTVAIGGLTAVQEGKQTSRVPLLGSIPVIGKLLFSHTRDVQEQVETIIFVTLSVADPDRLIREAGIPEDSRLVHQRLLREDVENAMPTAEEEPTNVEAEEPEQTLEPAPDVKPEANKAAPMQQETGSQKLFTSRTPIQR